MPGQSSQEFEYASGSSRFPKKDRGGLPPLTSCAPVSVAEYASISLTIPKNPRISLEILE